MNRLLTIGLIAFALVSCDKTALPGIETGDMVNLYLVPTSGTSVSGSARFAATGPNEKPFLANNGYTTNPSAIGVCIYPAGTNFAASPQYYTLPGYHNIKGTGTRPSGEGNVANTGYATTWTYVPFGGSTVAAHATNAIGLSTSITETPHAVDVYGYYPYRPDVDRGNMTAYPFTVGITDSTNYDFMFTGLKTVTPSTSPGAADLYPPFEFEHAMPVLHFKLQTSYTGPLMINSIKLTAVDRTLGTPLNVFAKEGTINLTNGVITPNPAPTNYSSELTVDFKKWINRARQTGSSTIVDSTSCCLVFPEINNPNAKIKIDFILSDPNGPTSERILISSTKPMEIDLGDATFGGALRANYRYIFAVIIDNYIKYIGEGGSFTGATLTIDNSSWLDVDVPDIEI